MSTPHKLRIKVGPHEFEAEGSEASVKDQFQQFLSAISAMGQSQITVKPTDGKPANGLTTLHPEDLQRIFTEEREDVVSLRVLPQTDEQTADSVIMILYGFRALRQQHDVPAADLLTALRLSGIRLTRLDRVLAICPTLFNRGGSRKGSRYALTNLGVTHAEKLINAMKS